MTRVPYLVVLGILTTELLAAFQFIYRWGAAEWSTVGTLAAVVVALIGSAQARGDARREIAANDVEHKKDVQRLRRQHRESLAQAARLHRDELDRAERRHLEVLAREHVRDQIAAARDVVRQLGVLLLPTTVMCDALEELGRRVGTRQSSELGPEVDECLRTFSAWSEALLVFDSTVVSAEMVTTNSVVFEVLAQIKHQEKTLGDVTMAQQRAIMGDRQRGDVCAIRAAFGELAKLNEPLRKAVAYNLRPVFLGDRSERAKVQEKQTL